MRFEPVVWIDCLHDQMYVCSDVVSRAIETHIQTWPRQPGSALHVRMVHRTLLMMLHTDSKSMRRHMPMQATSERG